jgi:hypothetical protein
VSFDDLSFSGTAVQVEQTGWNSCHLFVRSFSFFLLLSCVSSRGEQLSLFMRVNGKSNEKIPAHESSLNY